MPLGQNYPSGFPGIPKVGQGRQAGINVGSPVEDPTIQRLLALAQQEANNRETQGQFDALHALGFASVLLNSAVNLKSLVKLGDSGTTGSVGATPEFQLSDLLSGANITTPPDTTYDVSGGVDASGFNPTQDAMIQASRDIAIMTPPTYAAPAAPVPAGPGAADYAAQLAPLAAQAGPPGLAAAAVAAGIYGANEAGYYKGVANWYDQINRAIYQPVTDFLDDSIFDPAGNFFEDLFGGAEDLFGGLF